MVVCGNVLSFGLMCIFVVAILGDVVDAKGHRTRNGTTRSHSRKTTSKPTTTSHLKKKTTKVLVLEPASTVATATTKSAAAVQKAAEDTLLTPPVISATTTHSPKPKHPKRGNKERKANRTRRFIVRVGSGSAIGTANAVQGQTSSRGNTFTDQIGGSQSFASGYSAGYAPSSSAVATSASQGLRKKRQLGNGFGFPGVFPAFGTGTGTAIGTANAAMGQSLSNGNTFTNPFGGSQSFANAMSSGYAPSSTSIATSGSQGRRKKRQLGGMGFGGMGMGSPFGAFPSMFGAGSGTAIGTANAAMGQSVSNGNTITDPFGNSRSSANGMASGYFPSSTSIANSQSQGMRTFGFGRKKRQIFPINGAGTGTAIGTANAAMGQTYSNGNTFANPFGNSVSSANGMASGYAPASSSIATSGTQGYSAFVPFLGRRKRATLNGTGEIPSKSNGSKVDLDQMIADEHLEAFDFNSFPIGGFNAGSIGSNFDVFSKFPKLADPFSASFLNDTFNFSEATKNAITSGKGSFSGVIAAALTKSDGTITKIHQVFSHVIDYPTNTTTTLSSNNATETQSSTETPSPSTTTIIVDLPLLEKTADAAENI